VSGQLDAPAALSPRLKTPGYPLNRRLGHRGEEKNIFSLLKIKSFLKISYECVKVSDKV
jgi:hypothetical protein